LRQKRDAAFSNWRAFACFWRKPPAGLIVAATLGAHLGYYTLITGGDHFEFRVYSYLIPLIFVSFAGMLDRLGIGGARAHAAMAAFILCSLPIPWTHWALSQRLTTRQQTFHMKVAVSPHLPGPLRWYGEWFDGVQFWLIDRFACTRHQEHKICHLWQVASYPPRSVGAQVPRDGFPVLVEMAVGVPAWVLPKVNVLDYWGLNDYVVARAPLPQVEARTMAHSRKPPPGYFEAFQPNVKLLAGRRIGIEPRLQPLTTEAIRRIEAEWIGRVSR
jgi:arabinofuranosyltransferase